MKGYFNSVGFERWNKIYGTTDEISSVSTYNDMPRNLQSNTPHWLKGYSESVCFQRWNKIYGTTNAFSLWNAPKLAIRHTPVAQGLHKICGL